MRNLIMMKEKVRKEKDTRSKSKTHAKEKKATKPVHFPYHQRDHTKQKAGEAANRNTDHPPQRGQPCKCVTVPTLFTGPSSIDGREKERKS